MKLSNIFERKEVKYRLTHKQYQDIQELLKDKMQEDKYGEHSILSLYYDTDDYQMIRKSIEKPDYKEKFRIRSYGCAEKNKEIFLEIKKKINGIVYKRREKFILNELNFKSFLKLENQTQREINYLFSKYPLKAKVLIAYERVAMYDKETKEFRITFDKNIRYRKENLSIKDSSGEAIDPELEVLMEVKALGAYPIWFVSILNQFKLQKSSFSKFATSYKNHLQFEKENDQLSA
ncbi:MAG: VTC domain-containing protein [Lactovum sp.]